VKYIKAFEDLNSDYTTDDDYQTGVWELLQRLIYHKYNYHALGSK